MTLMPPWQTTTSRTPGIVDISRVMTGGFRTTCPAVIPAGTWLECRIRLKFTCWIGLEQVPCSSRGLLERRTERRARFGLSKRRESTRRIGVKFRQDSVVGRRGEGRMMGMRRKVNKRKAGDLEAGGIEESSVGYAGWTARGSHRGQYGHEVRGSHREVYVGKLSRASSYSTLRLVMDGEARLDVARSGKRTGLAVAMWHRIR
ncbi:hypothetical protein C8F04DRAFT_1235255 [Mycena alexandri]|uniref:Uncharacterized protein n=1 Tax=Mycena alexandri TaxID=1745969 RepID=A0AAD6SVS1_9AGAR|nr:hypothetical protein C8F04DRAFT_1235255 [Mycena alexandri]